MPEERDRLKPYALRIEWLDLTLVSAQTARDARNPAGVTGTPGGYCVDRLQQRGARVGVFGLLFEEISSTLLLRLFRVRSVAHQFATFTLSEPYLAAQEAVSVDYGLRRTYAEPCPERKEFYLRALISSDELTKGCRVG